MPKWRIKNIIMCGIAFTITLAVMFGIGFLNIDDTLKFTLMFLTMILTVASVIFINEKRLKKENNK